MKTHEKLASIFHENKCLQNISPDQIKKVLHYACSKDTCHASHILPAPVLSFLSLAPFSADSFIKSPSHCNTASSKPEIFFWVINKLSFIYLHVHKFRLCIKERQNIDPAAKHSKSSTLNRSDSGARIASDSLCSRARRWLADSNLSGCHGQQGEQMFLSQNGRSVDKCHPDSGYCITDMI